MKVFVFGAGASLASQIERNNLLEKHRAPLVNELFNPCYHYYALDLGFSKEEFVEVHNLMYPEGSIEKWLTNKWSAISLKKNNMTMDAERKDFGRMTFYI